MSTYNFHLADRVTHSAGVWGEGTAYVVGCYLQEFFNEVCGSPDTPYSESDFFWDTAPGLIRGNEVLVYFVNNKGDSLVKQVSPSASLGVGGTTRIHPAGNLSEVYVTESLAAMGGGSDAARGLAVLAFHEIMHNKLRMGNNLHSQGGGGMASATVFANTKLTPGNVTKMAPTLAKAVAQDKSFVGGAP